MSSGKIFSWKMEGIFTKVFLITTRCKSGNPLKGFNVLLYYFKCTLAQNIFILKSAPIGHINSLNIGGLNEFF